MDVSPPWGFNNLFEIVSRWHKFSALLGTIYLWWGDHFTIDVVHIWALVDHFTLDVVHIWELVELYDHCEIMFKFLIEALKLVVDTSNLLDHIELHLFLSFMSSWRHFYLTHWTFHDDSCLCSWRFFPIVRSLFSSHVPEWCMWRVWRQIVSTDYYSILSCLALHHKNIDVVIVGYYTLILDNSKCFLTPFWGFGCILLMVSNYIVQLISLSSTTTKFDSIFVTYLGCWSCY